MKQRILWADILKWAGMLLIYLGHLPVSENTYLFIQRPYGDGGCRMR